MPNWDGVDEEEWRPVVGYEGIYEVSDRGRIRSLGFTDSLGRHRAGRMKSPAHTADGHLQTRLSKDGVLTGHMVHRLVLEAFEGPCPDGMEACHWNDVPDDNRLENLRWGTHAENMRDRTRNGHVHVFNRTRCPAGHEFSEENTLIDSHGWKYCRACHARRESDRRKRQKEMAA